MLVSYTQAILLVALRCDDTVKNLIGLIAVLVVQRTDIFVNLNRTTEAKYLYVDIPPVKSKDNF